VTTSNLIDSIIKANDKGKIKIKKVIDNTAKEVEVQIDLAAGISPQVTMDALYAFTNCEVSISPNACVIIDDKPHFLSVNDILKVCTERTKALLKLELEIKLSELQEKWHFASLEKIFIQNRIYREIEECESWEEVLKVIAKELKKYVITPEDGKAKRGDKRIKLLRDVTVEDITRLTEIKIRRISKYNAFKADELIARLTADIKQTKYDLKHLTDFSIAYYQNLLDKYGKGRERRTEITSFETIKARAVVANNTKLYINRKEGFIGSGLRKDEFVCDCADIDDIIIFRKDGVMKVVRMGTKVFVGKNVLHVAVWKKGDERMTYNMIYLDAKTGKSMAKRFPVKGITRDRDYDLTKGAKSSKIHYLSANPNGESEVVTIVLSPTSKARKKVFDYYFEELDIKTRSVNGNIVTQYPIKKITFKEAGKSSLGAQKIFMDNVSGRLNTEERGVLLGDYDTGDKIFAIYKDGTYEVNEADLTKKYETKELLHIGKFSPKLIVNAVYFDGTKKWTMVKRFKIETTTDNTKYNFITDHRSSKLFFVSVKPKPVILYDVKEKKEKVEYELKIAEFIDVKGWKAAGNRLEESRIMNIRDNTNKKKKLSPGDSIDFDVDDKGQGKMF